MGCGVLEPKPKTQPTRVAARPAVPPAPPLPSTRPVRISNRHLTEPPDRRPVRQPGTPPRTIEGVDIAHLGGTETVASLVQFIDGLPCKQGYRRYRIREVKGIDDFQSMHEVVSRRFQHLHDQSEVLPDILLIDGGKGQLNAALSAFTELQIPSPLVISLAKREEEIYLPGQEEPLRLSRHAFALRLLQYVRDEAHRFAQHYHHILRRKSTLGE